MVHAIKKPALEAIETIFDPDASKIKKLRAANELWKAFKCISKMPEPTVENTWHPNSHNLIKIRDWLFEHCFLDAWRMGFIRKLMNFVIILYDFDPPWRWIMDSAKDEALKMDWKLRGFEDTWVDGYHWWKE